MRCESCAALVADRREHATWVARRALDGEWAGHLTHRGTARTTLLVAVLPPAASRPDTSPGQVAAVDGRGTVILDTAGDDATDRAASEFAGLLTSATRVLAWQYDELRRADRWLDRHADRPRREQAPPCLAEVGEELAARYTRWLNPPRLTRDVEPRPAGTAVQSLTTMLRHLREMARTEIPPGALDELVLPAPRGPYGVAAAAA